jgi:hypothetical protein
MGALYVFEGQFSLMPEADETLFMPPEDDLLRSVALQKIPSILAARAREEMNLPAAREALRETATVRKQRT